MKNYYRSLIFCLIGCLLVACQKDWLNVKPSQNLTVPTTTDDYQALLDNDLGGGPGSDGAFNINMPVHQIIASNEFTVDYSYWQSADVGSRNAYVWAKALYEGIEDDGDWSYAYNRILNANVVLDGIQDIPENASNQIGWNNVKGSALFFRAFDFYNLAQEYCKPYIATSASTDLGIPLKLSSILTDKTTRATVQQTYSQIINDLNTAAGLLPDLPLLQYKTRPSRAAVYGLLARVYLAMSDYKDALNYSNKCLQIYSTLLNYNTISPSASTPFPLKSNTEIIFFAETPSTFISHGIPDTSIFAANDLRKPLFLSTTKTFKGTYSGNKFDQFLGIATDEQYLISAECYARQGDITNALSNINAIYKNRCNPNSYTPYAATTADEALALVLAERRRELLYRGLRWTDLRRLNLDPKYAITLTRVLNGQTYTLPPNDPRYVFLIPPDEIQASGIPQNPR